jgi:hypothetical protein
MDTHSDRSFFKQETEDFFHFITQDLEFGSKGDASPEAETNRSSEANPNHEEYIFWYELFFV